MVDREDEAGGRESLLLRGTLDMCVMSLLRSPNHAYGVVQQLHEAGFSQVGYGTVYPLVTRLRRLGLVSQKTLPGDGGPAKNVLRLTARGRATLAGWEAHWQDHHRRVSALLGAEARVAAPERTVCA